MPSGDTAHSDDWFGPTGRGLRRNRRVTAGLKPVGLDRLEMLLAGDVKTTRAEGTAILGSATKTNVVLRFGDERRVCRVVAWADGFVGGENRSHPTVAVVTDATETFLIECDPTSDWERFDIIVRAQWARPKVEAP